MKHANKIRAILSSHYGRKVDDVEALQEVYSLRRKQVKGSLDDRSEFLVARLEGATGEELKELLS